MMSYVAYLDNPQDLESDDMKHIPLVIPVLLNASSFSADEVKALVSKSKSVWVSVTTWDANNCIKNYLDQGVDRIIFSPTSTDSLRTWSDSLDLFPSERLGLDITKLRIQPFTPKSPHSVLIVSENSSLEHLDNISGIYRFASRSDLTQSLAVIPASRLKLGKLTAEELQSNPDRKFSLTSLLWARTKSDREDSLVPTIVSDTQGVALGLCYSNEVSFERALITGKGVYHSRTRGLWEKGASSGATQKLVRVDWDCDSDTLRFTVEQKAPGFCHLNTRTCFGEGPALSSLFETLQERLESAPTGSYTKRLFDDEALLHSKIREEAQELVEAKTKDEIAWEAADLLYFAIAKCVKMGVSLDDVEEHLKIRSKKITRRPGNAKRQFMETKSSDDAKEAAKKAKLVTDLKEAQGNFLMNRVPLNSQNRDKVYSFIQRPIIKTDEIMSRVRPIVDQVRTNGDSALISLTQKFDGVKLASPVMLAPFDPKLMQLSEKVKSAIDLAYSNLEKFHVAQLDSKPLVVETMKGVTCSRFLRPISRVGLYVPGGTAILPSTTLHLGVPAKVAGCETIVVATPPRKDGSVCPEVLYVAQKIGAKAVVLAGGAQAVAAMAYGTATVPKVDKICGPGNQYVTAAKMIVQSDNSAMTSIDMPAGPSELLVIMDSSADPRYVVSDLLSQAEHGVDSQVILVTVGLSASAISAVEKELVTQASVLPRADIVKVSIGKSYLVEVKTMEEALDFSNQYAPEHLILNVINAESYLSSVQNAGSVFVGPYSPESCGDYASGTNHTLPTYGYARMYSGVNTNTFLKHLTSQTLTRAGLDAIGDAVTTLAEIEGLEAHRNAVAIRLTDIRAKKQ